MTASRWWLTDAAEDVTAAIDDGDMPWLVDPDGVVRNVQGQATIALCMLIDRRLLALQRTAEEADREIARRSAEIGTRVSEHGDGVNAVRRDVEDLRERWMQLAETAVDVLASRPGGTS